MNILLSRFDQQLVPFSRFVLAYILAQEVEPFFDMGDDCFLWRELQSAFPHELLHKGVDFLFQEFFRSTCDNEVICLSDEVTLCVVVFTSSLRVVRESFP